MAEDTGEKKSIRRGRVKPSKYKVACTDLHWENRPPIYGIRRLEIGRLLEHRNARMKTLAVSRQFKGKKMSCAVMWRKVDPKKGKYVGSGYFREIIDRKFGFPAKLNFNDIPYLEGIKDCGHEEAQILIEAIREEEVIEVFLEC